MNLDFRPRPIDSYKSLQILIQAEGEDDFNFKSAATVKTGMEKEEEAEAHLIRALSTTLIGKRSVFIPTPVTREIQLDSMEKFEVPYEYVRFTEKTPQEEYNIIHYDMEEEDFKFLDEYNDQHTNGGERSRKVNEIVFEMVIDKLEKERHLQNRIPNAASVEKMFNLDTELFQSIYQHWLRRIKLQETPLLERLRAPPDADDPSPLVAFRPRSKLTEHNFKLFGSSDAIQQRLSTLLDDLLHVRKLMDLTRKREKKKIEIVKLRNDIFNARMRDIEKGGKPKEKQSRTYRKNTGVVSTPEIIPLDFDSTFVSPIYSSDDSNYASDTDSSAFTDEPNKDKLSIDPFSRMPSSMSTPVARTQEEDQKSTADNLKLMLEFSSTLKSVVESSGGKTDGVSTPADPTTPHFKRKFGSLMSYEKPRIGRGGRIIFDRSTVLDNEQHSSHAHIVYAVTPH